MAERDKRRGASRRAPERAGASERREQFSSIDALRRRVPAIVDELNAEPALALRAAANPILALEELGYTLTDALKQELERRVRFDEQTAARLEQLTHRAHELAGEPFDLDSPDETARILFSKLGLRRPDPVQRLRIAEGALSEQSAQAPQRRELGVEEVTAIPRRRVGDIPASDPLAVLRDAHPVMPPLLEYRAIQASVPPLAPRELYERLARGDVEGPRLTIKARLRRGTQPDGPDA